MTAQAMESISAKLRPDGKRAIIKTCESIGTSPSNAIRMFVSAFNNRGGLPFDPSNPYGFSAETLTAMEDAVNERVSGSYSSVDDAIADLGEDSCSAESTTVR